jgi:parvulin-like peptidyl-prolyl isomerase
MTIITNKDLLHQLKISGKVPETIHGILQQLAIESAAQELGIEISDKELQEGADQFRATNKLTTVAETEQWFQDQMLSVDDFEHLITLNLLTNKVGDRLFSRQVEPFFYQHILDYAAALIYEVVVTDKNLAIELYYAVQEGDMTFADVAKKYGQDIETQRQGGYQGIVPRKKMLPEISAAVFAAQPPQILEPISAAKGIYLIWVEELTKPELTDALHEQIQSQLFQEWLQKKINELRSTIKFG